MVASAIEIQYAKGLAISGRNVIGLSAYDERIATPIMIVRKPAVENNIDVMAEYCRQHNIVIAPHAKTTMSPEIVEMQLMAGAWAITVANVSQALALLDVVEERILIANEVVDTAA